MAYRKGHASGYSISAADARIVIGMLERGDRDNDIAAWFGVNQGRVSDVKEGRFKGTEAAPNSELPPRGPPGIKGRILRAALDELSSLLASGNVGEAITRLDVAREKYDASDA